LSFAKQNRYAHDLEKRQQAVRSGEIKKLPRSETHSSAPKIAFTSQDDGASFPGGISSSSSPPAYTVSEATDMVGGDHGSGGYAPRQETEVKKRKVPAPPVPSR
jgi:hypothetical protein